MFKSKSLFAALAVIAVAAFCLGTAFAEDEAPTSSVEKKVEDTTAPKTTEAVEVKTKTETPMCSMLSWIGEQIKTSAGEECKCCNKAMTAWFAGGKDIPLSGMRDRLVADGWTAESTIAFFKQMKAERAAAGKGCDGCAKGAASDCQGCDKSEGASDCDGCDKSEGASDCDGCEGCEGCEKGNCPCEGAAKDAPAKPSKKDAQG